MSEIAVVEDLAPEVLVRLDQMSAERLDKRVRLMAGTVRENFEKVGRLLDEAKAGQVHEVLGFKSWPAYVADALGGQLQLSRGARQVMVAVLAGEGMSERAIAEAVGASQPTVHRDLQVIHDESPEVVASRLADGDEALADKISEALRDPLPDTVTTIDNKTYTKPKPRPKKEPEPVVVIEDCPLSAVVEEPESDSLATKDGRRPQLPTMFRATAQAVHEHARLLHDLTTDPRWAKALQRIAKDDADWLDDTIATLEGIRAALGMAS